MTMRSSLTLLALLLLLASCKRADPVLGRWVDVEGSGWTEYFPDGDVIFNDGSKSMSGKWTRLGDGRIKVDRIVRGGESVEVYAVSVEGNDATFTSSEGDEKKYQRSAAMSKDRPDPASETAKRQIKDEEAQRLTVAEIRTTGKAMFSWLTDQVGAAAAGVREVEDRPGTHADLLRYSRISRPELERILYPQYLRTVPEMDAWGNPYEYYLSPSTPLAQQVMSIRSPGRDGVFTAMDYTISPTDPSDFDADIVWADGYFVRFPQEPRR